MSKRHACTVLIDAVNAWSALKSFTLASSFSVFLARAGCPGTSAGGQVLTIGKILFAFSGKPNETDGFKLRPTSARDADDFIREGKVDLVFLARTLLANPHWPYRAARELQIANPASVLPTPYAFWLQDWAC